MFDIKEKLNNDLSCMLRFQNMIKEQKITNVEAALEGCIQGKAEYLFDEYKPEIDAWVDDIVVEVDELDSYHRNSNPYGVEAQYARGESDWDEEEERQAKIRKSLEYLKTDKIYDYFTMDFNENVQEKMHEMAVKYLEGKLDA